MDTKIRADGVGTIIATIALVIVVCALLVKAFAPFSANSKQVIDTGSNIIQDLNNSMKN